MTAELTETPPRRRRDTGQAGTAPAGTAHAGTAHAGTGQAGTGQVGTAPAAPASFLARVDLLPPIVEVRRRQRGTIRLLMLGLVGLVLVSAAVGLAVSFLAGAAEAGLGAEQQRSQMLKLEQGTYAEVSTVKSQLKDYESAETAALFAEADWARLMTQLDDVLPDTITLTSEQITVKGVAPGGATAESTGLDAPGVIEISFTATADSFDSPTPLLNALQKLTGHVSATVDGVSASDQDGYVITGIVQLDADALGGTARTGALDADTLADLHRQLQDAATGATAAGDDAAGKGTDGDGTAADDTGTGADTTGTDSTGN
ncbi:hypothetical protein [Microbacterium luticocti]|uniref:hypothetical protein n=1 Tax=Microbacterium luticocti TaxID=451764 RepID=UPI00042889E5|nr:hypothetical protein [Microbacterium luticocti]